MGNSAYREAASARKTAGTSDDAMDMDSPSPSPSPSQGGAGAVASPAVDSSDKEDEAQPQRVDPPSASDPFDAAAVGRRVAVRDGRGGGGEPPPPPPSRQALLSPAVGVRGLLTRGGRGDARWASTLTGMLSAGQGEARVGGAEGGGEAVGRKKRAVEPSGWGREDRREEGQGERAGGRQWRLAENGRREQRQKAGSGGWHWRRGRWLRGGNRWLPWCGRVEATDVACTPTCLCRRWGKAQRRVPRRPCHRGHRGARR